MLALTTLHHDLLKLRATIAELRSRHAQEIERTTRKIGRLGKTIVTLSGDLDMIDDNLNDAIDTVEIANELGEYSPEFVRELVIEAQLEEAHYQSLVARANQ